MANAATPLYAIVAFIGLRVSIADFFTHAKSWMSVPVNPQPKAKKRAGAAEAPDTVISSAGSDWASVLHFGSGEWSTGGRPVAAPGILPSQRSSSEGRGRVSEHRSFGAEEPSFRTVFQPILELDSGHVTGREALTRFDDGIAPHERLAEEAARGNGLELEILLARASVQAAADFSSAEWLGLNVSVGLIRAGRALSGIVERARREVVLEIDARALVGSPEVVQLLTQIPSGSSLAITAVDPSYDCLTLVREMRPAFVKLDRAWVRGLAGDPARMALVRALVALAAQTDSGLIAEGIETQEELDALKDAGVRFGQGYLLGRPRASAVSV
jgi:EAL domain-containing protein (putative c-di-GMP-specific phosphodiesterase class I)